MHCNLPAENLRKLRASALWSIPGIGVSREGSRLEALAPSVGTLWRGPKCCFDEERRWGSSPAHPGLLTRYANLHHIISKITSLGLDAILDNVTQNKQGKYFLWPAQQPAFSPMKMVYSSLYSHSEGQHTSQQNRPGL